MHCETDVLVIGAGGAGMYAAIAAERAGTKVLLVDKNVVGRGGATIMAQMTVAAAVGEEEPDSVEEHYADTLEAGGGPRGPAPPRPPCPGAPPRGPGEGGGGGGGGGGARGRAGGGGGAGPQKKS